MVQHTARLTLAVLPGALLAGLLSWLTRDSGLGVVLAAFVISIAAAGLGFVVLAGRLRVAEMADLLAVLRRRRRGTGSGVVCGDRCSGRPGRRRRRIVRH